MKIIITISLILAFAYPGTIQSQSLIAIDATSYVTGDTSQKNTSVRIANISADTIFVKVSQDNSAAVSGHVVYFCWGVICYPPTISVSPTPVMLAPGDTTTSFIGYLVPNGQTGISVINYEFFDRDNTSDAISVSFTYDITTGIGIEEYANQSSASAAFPNPADYMTQISYDLKSAKNAKLVFYNVLGSAVKEIQLVDQQNTLSVPTSAFTSGIYYYSIVADGKIMPAKRLVVAHR